MTVKQPKFTKIFAAHDNARERAEYAAVVWAETVAEMGDALTKCRAAMVERYVLMRTEYEFLYSSATFEGPVQTGPNGGDVYSMRYAAILKLSDTLSRMEEHLMISPKAAGDRPEGDAPELPEAAARYLARSKAH